MKSKKHFRKSIPWWRASILVACSAAAALSAADGDGLKTEKAPASEPKKDTAPADASKKEDASASKDEKATDEKKKEEEKAPELTPEEMFEGGATPLNNWIEFSTGGFLRSGNNAQFQQRHRAYDGPFGGIEDFHYQQEVATNTVFSVDGRALFDLDDYKLKLSLVKEKTGYVRLSYDEFRTWSNADGSFYPPTGAFFPFGSDALELDRGKVSFEAGLTLENKPKVVFKYDHLFREGEKGSTIWGVTHPNIGVTRSLSPTYYKIDESTDVFQLDVTHSIKLTDFGIGLRYETGKLDNSLRITQAPGEPVQQKITDHEETRFDLFSAHAFSESWIKEKVLVSTGFSVTDLENDFSGSRIYGSDFDVNYVPNALAGSGFVGLNGGSHLREYVMNLNVLFTPITNLTVVPSLRVQQEDTDADFTGRQTQGLNPTAPFSGTSERDVLDVRERLDLRYSGLTNWVFFSRGEWTIGQGNLRELGGTGQVGAGGIQPISRETEDDRFFQKYSLGARWYPLKRLTLDAEGYYKRNHYGYDHVTDSTPNNSANRYPAYLVLQNFDTYDAHLGMTLSPWKTVTLASRYEYQLSKIHTKPDAISGLSEIQSSRMVSHIISQNINWIPWSRLYLQAGVDYVVSKTETADDVTRAILDAQNNYWIVTFNSRFVLDNKTDLNLAYFYYVADNYDDNSSASVPYGADAKQHEMTATVVRRIRENLRLKLKYGYFRYSDETFGGSKDYDAHGLSSSLQYRF
jgi:hypothetical protein